MKLLIFIREVVYLKKDGTYTINVGQYESVGTHWLALYVNGDNITYFDSFGLQYIPKEVNIFIHKKYHHKYLRNTANNSIICGYFCIGFLVFVLKGRSLLDCINMFSPNKYGKNNKMILECLKN